MAEPVEGPEAVGPEAIRGTAAPGGDVDGWVDDFVEGDLDWRQSVRRYTIPALAFAALGGFFLGRRYGLQLFGDLSAFAAEELLRQVPQALEGLPRSTP